jgi:predicted small lipoprotein YifL
MQTVPSRPFLRLAVIGALIASLGLAACGRKGPLDPPPGASLDNQPQPEASTMRSPIGASPIGGGSGGSGDAVMSADGRAQAPKGPNKKIPLDVLLN